MSWEWAKERRLPWKLRWLKYIRVKQPFQSIRAIASELTGQENAASIKLQVYGAEVLAETLIACRQANIKPFLAFGTLLGHCREGGFIKHDADIDLGILESDRDKTERLVQLMTKSGFVVRLLGKDEVSFYKPHFPTLLVDFFVFWQTQDDIAYYDRRGDTRYEFRFPKEIFAELTPVRFLGYLEAFVPVQAERFLEVSYGDWRTPRPSFDNVHGHPNCSIVERH